MTLELPVLRLGLAGFSAEQQGLIATTLRDCATGAALWELAGLDVADAWWVNGAMTRPLDDGRIRIAAATPSAHAVQVRMADVARPVAFAQPMPEGMEARYIFDLASRAAMNKVLETFEQWLAPVAAQFCLAAHIVEHESALRSGIYDVSTRGTLLAVVNMRGEAGVLPTAGPADFEEAVWGQRSVLEMPEAFVRTGLSQLMWQYAIRTQRDLLPRHYRTALLYYRRPPRVEQRWVTDSHLLWMRELLVGPATFTQLQERCGVGETRLAHDLAALYFAGSITSNPKRAAHLPGLAADTDGSAAPSSLGDSVLPNAPAGKRPVLSDLTAPAPMGPH